MRAALFSRIFLGVFFSVSSLLAADWAVDGNANWNDNGNWNNPSTFPNGTDAVADFTKLDITATRTISMQAVITIGSLLVGDDAGNNYYDFVNGSGSLTFDVSSGSALFEQVDGSGGNRVNASVTLMDDLVVRSTNTAGQLIFYGNIDNGGNDIILEGNGSMRFNGSVSTVVSGAGGLIKNGNGNTTMASNPQANHTYTGATIINGGNLMFFNNLPGGNLTLNDGVYANYWNGSLSRNLGSGSGQIQVLGGTSGFSANNSLNVTLSGGSLVVWGSQYFNPEALVVQSPVANSGATCTMSNPFDLNGTNRTIAVTKNHGVDNGFGRMSGVISDSSGGNASLIKIGVGRLQLSAVNTYQGETIVEKGYLQLAGSSTLSDDAALRITAGATIELNTGVNETVKFAYYDDSPLKKGTWGSTSSAATNQDDTIFSGDGILNVLITGPLDGTVIMLL